MTTINLDQFLGEPAKPFTTVSLGGKDYPVFHPDDLSQRAYLKYQAAQAGLTEALEQNAPSTLEQAQGGDSDVKVANKIKKIWARNKSKVKKFRVYEKIDAGLYWPWEETGPIKIKVVHEDGTPFTEDEVEQARSSVEVLITKEIEADLNETDKKCTRQRIFANGEEWGFIESLHAVDPGILEYLCSEISLVIPEKDGRTLKMSELPKLTAAQYPFRQAWCEALFDDADFTLEGRPPKLVNYLFNELGKELNAYNERMAKGEDTEPTEEQTEVLTAPKEEEKALVNI